MRKRGFLSLFPATVLMLAAWPLQAQQAPDAMIRDISTDVIESVKADPAIKGGDVGRITQLVDQKVMPHVNFQRMTAFAVGPAWRQATPEQKQKLQAEYKALLLRTYSGALTQVRDHTVQMRPSRFAPTDTDVTVRTAITSSAGEPIQLDYRLEKAGDTWRIYDVNVVGVWLGQQYRNSFAQEINAGGLDGLIAKLAERNKSGGGS